VSSFLLVTKLTVFATVSNTGALSYEMLLIVSSYGATVLILQ